MGGRGQAYLLAWGDQQLVLRHFRRGGLLGRLRDDAYFWTGLWRTRAFAEWLLLQRLHEADLPVPRPAAARVLRRGPLLYRADIMTVALPRTLSLADRLAAAPLEPGHWQALGATLRRFHRAGACHADLNAMNLLLDTGHRWYVIDWDKGRLRTPRPGWQRANLRRLRRSLQRLGERRAQFHFQERGWARLLEGYHSS